MFGFLGGDKEFRFIAKKSDLFCCGYLVETDLRNAKCESNQRYKHRNIIITF